MQDMVAMLDYVLCKIMFFNFAYYSNFEYFYNFLLVTLNNIAAQEPMSRYFFFSDSQVVFRHMLHPENVNIFFKINF